jgi:hypothetical protein
MARFRDRVRLDNALVRILEFHLKPGEKEVMHTGEDVGSSEAHYYRVELKQ